MGAKSVIRASALLVWIGLIAGGSIVLVVVAANGLDDSGTFPPEIVLPLIVILGVVALLATLAITAATFGLFEIADKGQALGLPAGSVQAVIALSLILIFAVVALYASSSSASKEVTSTGLTAAEVKGIPAEQVVSKQVENGSQGNAPTYEVVRAVEDEDLRDINTQLLTTVSTLVIAVAGFYFGSKSVQEGSKAAIEAAGPNRSLTVTPASPCIMDSDEPLDINVQSVPPGAQLNWALHDDPGGSLYRRQGGGFVYKPGPKMKGSGKSATLIFEQVEDPSTSALLLATFPKGEDEEIEIRTPKAQDPGPPKPKLEEGAEGEGEDEAQRQHGLTAERQARLREEAAKRPKIRPRPEEPDEPEEPDQPA